jgi:hypothetical protein
MMDRLVRLYTIQKPGHSITLRQNVSEQEINQGRLFHRLSYRMNRYAGSDPWYQVAQYLDWTSWASCLEDVQDYNSPWFALENLIQGDLWTLFVPQEKIRWCSLDAQGENLLPVQEWFYPYPENIRNEGETSCKISLIMTTGFKLGPKDEPSPMKTQEKKAEPTLTMPFLILVVGVTNI